MTTSTARRAANERGGALLAVLWLAAALAAIAFSVAATVRGETERAETFSEGVRARFLGVGAVERALCYMTWGPSHRNEDGSPKYYEPGMVRILLHFPSGFATVDIVPEYSKFDINRIDGKDLARLLVNLGQPPDRAEETAAAILDWRSPKRADLSPFDQFYLSRTPSFPARHASLEEIEELLLVKGMTPELFYGGFARDAQGHLMPTAGLKDCVSVFGSYGALDVNFVAPPVLATLGLSPEVITALVERRHALPFRDATGLAEFARLGGPGFSRLQIGGGTVFTLHASARILLPSGQLSDLVRDVSATVKFRERATPPYTILRWYEN